MPELDCRSHHETSRGFLNSTQCVEWDGPPLPERLYPALAARMDEEHVAAVGGSVRRFIRCRAEGDEVICTALGAVPVLTFGRPFTAIEALGVRRTWTVTGGALARRGDVYGSIRFDWRQEETGGGRFHHCLSAAVEGYPSRFLKPDGSAPVAALLRRVGGWYTGYHERVTCGFLRRLAQWIRASAEAE